MPRTRPESPDAQQARDRLRAIAARVGETAPPSMVASMASLRALVQELPPPVVTAPDAPDSLAGLVRVLQAAREEARERRLAEASA